MCTVRNAAMENAFFAELRTLKIFHGRAPEAHTGRKWICEARISNIDQGGLDGFQFGRLELSNFQNLAKYYN